MALTDYFATISLPDDIDPQNRQLLDGLDAMLERITPSRIDRESSRIEPGVEGVSIELRHLTNPALQVSIEAFGEEVVVSYGEEHEHFDVEHEIAEFAVGPFATAGVIPRVLAFLESLMTGRVELHVTHRLLYVRTLSYWINDAGERELFLNGGTVIPTFKWSKAPTVRTFDFR